jgi:hypothetical protein
MRRRDDNVIPFRGKPRKWTRPEDYGVPGVRSAPPRPGRAPADWARRRRALAVWALIFVLIALTVAWSAWDLWG